MKLVSSHLPQKVPTAQTGLLEQLQKEAARKAFLSLLHQGAVNPETILNELPPSNALNYSDLLVLKLLPASNAAFRKFATTCSFSELMKLALFGLRLVPQEEVVAFSEEVISFIRRHPGRQSCYYYHPAANKLRPALKAYCTNLHIATYYHHYFVWEVLDQHYNLRKPLVKTEELIAVIFGEELVNHWISLEGLDFLLEKCLRLYGIEETFVFLEARLRDTITLSVYQWSKYLEHLDSLKDLPLEWVAELYPDSEEVMD